jgi:hypothetical protein
MENGKWKMVKTMVSGGPVQRVTFSTCCGYLAAQRKANKSQ